MTWTLPRGRRSGQAPSRCILKTGKSGRWPTTTSVRESSTMVSTLPTTQRWTPTTGAAISSFRDSIPSISESQTSWRPEGTASSATCSVRPRTTGCIPSIRRRRCTSSATATSRRRTDRTRGIRRALMSVTYATWPTGSSGRPT